MEKQDVVLVPTDFSDVGDYAIEHGIGVAKEMGFSLCILHVVTKETLSNLKKEKKGIDEITKKLEKIVSSIKENHNIKADYIAKEGSIFQVIGKVTKEIGANIVIIGTHGKYGVQHLLGSYISKVISKSEVPVIVIQKKGFGDGYKNVVIALDTSTTSKQKVKWAVYMAKKLNSTIHLYSQFVSDTHLKIKLKKNISQIKAIFEQNRISYSESGASEKGNTVKQIVDYSEKVKADLIMIMTDNDSLLPNFIERPEEKIIFNPHKIPVMCINPKDLHLNISGY